MVQHPAGCFETQMSALITALDYKGHTADKQKQSHKNTSPISNKNQEWRYYTTE